MGTGIGKEKIKEERLFVVHVTASLGIGGAEAVLCSLIENLQGDDSKHVVITFHEGPYVERIRAGGIPVYTIKGLLFRYDPLFWIRLARLIKRLNPDCLHSLLWIANCSVRIIGAIFKIPVVSGMHNNVVINGAFRNCLDVYTLPLSSRIVVIHEGVYQSIIARCNKHAKLPITIIHNCIDEKRVHMAAQACARTREELGLRDDQFVVGAVGRLIPVKRYDLLIRQFARVYALNPHVRLILVGYGQEEARLRSLVHSLGCHNEVIFVVNEQAFGYFPLFNCFVLPSLTEGPSIALLEAMSFSLPCIVTHDEAKHPVIKAGINGLLVPAYDEEALGNSLINLIEDKIFCEQLGRMAKETVRSQFCAENMVCQYKKCFSEAAAIKQRVKM